MTEDEEALKYQCLLVGHLLTGIRPSLDTWQVYEILYDFFYEYGDIDEENVDLLIYTLLTQGHKSGVNKLQ